MAKQLFTNNAGSMLAVSITAGDLSLQVGGGHGSRFPNPTGGDWFVIALVDALGNLEVCKCTARSTDVLTIVRGQEGTSPQSWTGNACRVELRNTKGSMEQVVQRSGDTFTDLLAAGALDMNGNTIIDPVITGATITSPAISSPTITGSPTSTALAVANSVTVTGGSPFLILNESDGGADAKIWKADSIGTIFRLRTRTDVDGAGSTALEVTRSGTAVTDMSFGNGADDPTYTFLGSGGMTVGGEAVLTTETATGGTYTPTVTGLVNIGSVFASGDGMYTRTVDVVDVSLRVTIDPSGAGNTTFAISLPVASNFTDSVQASGMMVTDEGSGAVYVAGIVFGDASNDRVTVRFTALDADAISGYITFKYLVV